MKIILVKDIRLATASIIPEGTIMERLPTGSWVNEIHRFESTCGTHRLSMSVNHFEKYLNIDFKKYRGEDNMNEEIKSGQYMVGSIHKNTGNVSFSNRPKPHVNRNLAVQEARRLAQQCTEKKFVVVKVECIARTVEVVVD